TWKRCSTTSNAPGPERLHPVLKERSMTDPCEIEDHVRAYILDTFLSEAEAATLRDDTDLLGVLDSLQILRLVMALESAYAIKVRDGELAPENLGSVAKIGGFPRRKRAEAGEGRREPVGQPVGGGGHARRGRRGGRPGSRRRLRRGGGRLGGRAGGGPYRREGLPGRGGAADRWDRRPRADPHAGRPVRLRGRVRQRRP